MKLKFTACLLLLSAWIAPLSIGRAQGTAFTYQGRLNSSGGTANGTYDFQFRLAADPLANNYVGNPYSTNGILVTNGLFTATMDFGPGILNGSNYWLEVDVRTNGAGTFTALTPLQQLTPAPYAVFANTSSNLLGVLPAGQLSGPIANGNLPANPSFSGTVTAATFAGNGVNISNVNALALNGLVSSNFWQLGGNNVAGGQFLGSTNNQPVEIWSGNGRAFRVEPGLYGAPNVVGGSPANFVSNSIYGATIAGGGIVNFYPPVGTNAVTVPFGTVGGGMGNWVFGASPYSGGVIAGGELNNMTNAEDSVISGGKQNSVKALDSFIGGGFQNFIDAYRNYSVIAGGSGNQVFSTFPYDQAMTIGGGNYNTNQGGSSTIAGGGYNIVGVDAFASAIGGGYINMIQSNASYSTIAGGNGNQISLGTANGTIGGGTSNYVNGISGTVAGGEQNSASAFRDTVGGGILNTASGGISTVAGGWTNVSSGNGAAILGGSFNLASGVLSAVAGGSGNQATNNHSTAAGGYGNIAGGQFSFAAGSQALATNDGAFVWADNENMPFASTTTNQFNVRANGGVRLVTSGAGLAVDGSPVLTSGGGSGIAIQQNSSGAPNIIEGSPYNVVANGVVGAVIAGGATNYAGAPRTNSIYADFGIIAGGYGNTIQTGASDSFIGGGVINSIETNAGESFIGNGFGNFIQPTAGQSFIGTGNGNSIWAGSGYSFIGGGSGNSIRTNSSYSIVGGGSANTIDRNSGYSFIGGGEGNNTSDATYTALGGGQGNSIQSNANYSAIVGGWYNGIQPNAGYSFIGGGFNNQITNGYSVIPGGSANVAGGMWSFAAGVQAQALHQGTFVWADYENTPFSSTTTNQFNVRANGGVRFVTSGAGLTVDGFPVLTSGNGSGISIQNNSSGAPTIVEGSSANSAAVVGGTISGGGATNYSGQFGPNTVFADFGTISGGFSNVVTLLYGTVGGGRQNTASLSGTVAGGYQNFAGSYGTVGGGESNVISSGDHATIAGGNHNKITGYESTIGGGYYNLINGQDSVIAGGDLNVINSGASQSFIGGGLGNTNNASLAAIGGGQNNAAGGTAAAIPGGQKNIANGNFSFAAGQQAQALHQGSFVWADSQSGSFSSTTNDEFSIRANGGVRIQSDTGIHLNPNDRPIIVRDWDVFATNAPSYKAGIGRWGLFMEPFNLTIGIPDNIANRFFQIAKYSTNGTYTTLVLVNQAGDLFATNNVFAKGVQLTSDRNAKEHFTPLNPESVLAKVTAMPVTEWNYKSDAADTKHIGPVAQDFHAAFGLNGADDKHISAVDESGVALAAIQGLNQKVETLTAENAELKQRLAALEKLVLGGTDVSPVRSPQ